MEDHVDAVAAVRRLCSSLGDLDHDQGVRVQGEQGGGGGRVQGGPVRGLPRPSDVLLRGHGNHHYEIETISESSALHRRWSVGFQEGAFED